MFAPPMFFEGQFDGMSAGAITDRRRPRAIERHGKRREPVGDRRERRCSPTGSSPAPGRTGACSRCAGAGSRPARRSACAVGPARRSRSAVRGRSGRFSSSGASSAGPSSFSVPAPGRGRRLHAARAAEAARRHLRERGRRERQQRSMTVSVAAASAVGNWRLCRITRRTRCGGGRFAQLEQHAAGRGRVQEGDQVAARARARRLVDQANARRLQRRERAAPGLPPRSRRGAGPGRGARGSVSSAALPAGRADLDGGVVVRRDRPRAGTRRRSSGSATVSRAPAASPNSVDRSRAAASRSATATAT